MVFAIAKIVYKKKLDEYWRILNALDADDQKRKSFYANETRKEPLSTDQIWLDQLEVTIKKYVGKIELTNNLLSNELIISERQLFRRVKRILGVTPNKFVQIMRVKLASEAIATGKYSTLAEISNIAGFDTPAYFSKLFTKIYGINVLDILHKGYHE